MNHSAEVHIHCLVIAGIFLAILSATLSLSHLVHLNALSHVWVLSWSRLSFMVNIQKLPWSRAGLCLSLYLERECVRIYQRRHARSTLKNGFAWFRPNRTSWSGFFVPGTIFGSIRFIWAKNQPSRPFHSKDTCPFGPYVLPFPILFYSIRDNSSFQIMIFLGAS